MIGGWVRRHPLVDFRCDIGTKGIVWPIAIAIVYLATLTPCRMLMTWVSRHGQSVLLAILMRASFTGSLLVLVPVLPVSLGFYRQSGFAVMLWGLVAVVAGQ